MTSHVAHHAIPLPAASRPAAHGLWGFVTDRFLLLPLGAVIALFWANIGGESYFQFSHAVAFAVNEIAMALFLALIAQEVLEALMPGGALHTWRRWTMSLVAAAGGIAGAAGVYLLWVGLSYEPLLDHAWPIACAIDVAAAYYVLKTIWHRSSLLPFVLLMALATDAVGVLVVALRPRTFLIHQEEGALLILLAVVVAAVMRRLKVRSFWPYIIISGTLSWFGLYMVRIHPALALLPIIPFLPHEPRSVELFADPKDDDAVHHFEHEWNELVQVILFMFGLVNAGVVLTHYDTGTWAVLAAAMVGRPLGILLAIAIGVMAGLHLPRHVGWRELVVVALATSSGFTFALFFATGLIPMGPTLAQIKLGALSTVAAAALAIGCAHLLRVGRFARRVTEKT